MASPVVNPPTPYTTLIPGGFFPGKLIRIQGYVPMHGQRFDINLQTGAGGEIAGEDVGVHASVRLLEGYIARNSFQGGCWQEELGEGGLPIQLGQRFEILLLCETFEFKIAVNGQHFCSFPPRVPYNRITHLMIEGDVQLELISWEGSAASAPPINGPPQYGAPVPPPQYTPQQTFMQQAAPAPPPGAVTVGSNQPRRFGRNNTKKNLLIVSLLVTFATILFFGLTIYFSIYFVNKAVEANEEFKIRNKDFNSKYFENQHF